MGQAQPPISATTQALSITVATTSGDDGTGTWTFQSPPAGVTWTGTLTVSGGVTTAAFSVYIGGLLWGTFAGGSVFGPVQIVGQGSQQLIVQGSGLIAETDYTMSLIGSSDTATNVQPIYPEPTGSSTSVLQANNAGGVPLELDPLLYPDTPAGSLPAMVLGETVGLQDLGFPLGQTYSSWQFELRNTFEGVESPRQWLITSNGVSVLTPFLHPWPQGSGFYASVAGGSWIVDLPFSDNFVNTVAVQLVAGPAVSNGQIQYQMTGYSNNQVQAITNTVGTTLAVTPLGGLRKATKTGPLTANVSYQVAQVPYQIDDGLQYAIRIHSITWSGMGANNFTLTGSDGSTITNLFTVVATSGVQPQFSQLGGLIAGNNVSVFGTNALTANFYVALHYDIVPITQPGAAMY